MERTMGCLFWALLALACATGAETTSVWANFSVVENQVPPVAVGTIDISHLLTAGDKVTYYLVDADPSCGSGPCVAVNRNNGTVTVRRAFDREEVCPDLSTVQCWLAFKVLVRVKSDTRAEESSVDVQLQLLIVDQNDYVPVFEKAAHTLEVSEDQRSNTLIQLPAVVDLDSPRFRVTDCVLEAVNANDSASLPFELDKTFASLDGSVLLDRMQLRLKPGASLDRERVPSYTLLLRARDGPLDDLNYNTATLSVLVLVQDVNDNDPLVQPVYNVTVAENVPVGSSIVRVLASDADSGKNGDLLFSIPVSDQPRIAQLLELNATSGEIRNRRLFNYEQKNSYHFSVVVSDGGNPARSATTSIHIQITDVNDEQPQICMVQDEGDSHEACTSLGSNEPVIQENRPPNSLVAKVRVSDADSNPQFREIACDPIPSDAPFYLERLDADLGRNVHYALRTSVPLDREQKASYALPVICTDGSSNTAQTTTQTLSVRVGDENDNAPLFNTVSVTEERDEEEPIALRVKQAVDPDDAENGTVRYSLLENFGRFQIDPVNALLTSAALDREQQSSFELVILAHDMCNVERLSSSITYNLRLRDINDHAPQVRPFYKFHVREDAFLHGVQLLDLGNLNVSDPDDAENGEVSCELEGQQTSSFALLPFSVYSNCQVLLSAVPLDRERIAEYNGSVVVRDHARERPRTSTTLVTLVIDDVNDRTPQIKQPTNGTNVTFFVSLNPAALNHLDPIVTVLATDDDQPNSDNSKLLFAFTGSVTLNNLFSIDPHNGVIRLRPNRTLTKDDLGHYRVDVIVRDCGEPELGSWVSFRIILKEAESEVTVYGLSDKPLSNVLMFVGIVVGFLVVTSVLITAILFTAKRLRVRKSKCHSRTPAKSATIVDASRTPLNAALAYALTDDSAACSPNGGETISCLMCDSLTMSSAKTCGNANLGVAMNGTQVCSARSQRALVGMSQLSEHVLLEGKLNGNEDMFGAPQPICEHCYVHSYTPCLQMQMQPGTPYCTVIPTAVGVSCHCPSDEGFSQTRTTDSNTSSVARFPAVCQEHSLRVDQPASTNSNGNNSFAMPCQSQSPRHRVASYTSMPIEALYFNNPNYNLLQDKQMLIQSPASPPSVQSPPSTFVPKPLFPTATSTTTTTAAARQHGTLKKLANPNNNANSTTTSTNANSHTNGSLGRSTPLSFENDSLLASANDATDKAYSTTQSFARLQHGNEKKSSSNNLQMVALGANNNNNHCGAFNTPDATCSTAVPPDCIQSTTFNDSTVV